MLWRCRVVSVWKCLQSRSKSLVVSGSVRTMAWTFHLKDGLSMFFMSCFSVWNFVSHVLFEASCSFGQGPAGAASSFLLSLRGWSFGIGVGTALRLAIQDMATVVCLWNTPVFICFSLFSESLCNSIAPGNLQNARPATALLRHREGASFISFQLFKVKKLGWGRRQFDPAKDWGRNALLSPAASTRRSGIL